MMPAMEKQALVTGASSGIGLAVARRLATRGYVVTLAARRKVELEAAAKEIEIAGGKARILVLDVADAAATVAAVQRVDDEVGGLDLVMANAGVGKERWGGKLTWADCAGIIAVNVAGAVATLTAVLPRMVERKKGHLVGVSSLAQYRGFPRSAAYSASKAFLGTFLESVRIDLHGTGVAVTDVQPGFVRTEMTAKNKFKMPFLVELDDAADRVVRGIEKRAAIVRFPLPLATAARISRFVPDAIFGRVVRRAR